MNKADIRKQIDELVKNYFEAERGEKKFVAGKSLIQYAGPVYDESEISAIFQCVLDGWFGISAKTELLQSRLAGVFGAESVFLANSGSSANLLAMASLCSPNFSRALKDGDEVITTASTFPTAFNPILQHRLVPVVVDVELGSYNMNTALLEKALSPKTKAIKVVHTLGNPCDMNFIVDFARKHGLMIIEDCCDALGSEFNGKKAGSFGIAGTTSFYVAHHMTTGEGGAVATSDSELANCLRSMRDWGRGCYCSGKMAFSKEGTCRKRFSQWIEDIPEVMDHKYVFTHIGYNLKPVEFQAAMGLVQIKRLPEFHEIRKRNFKALAEAFSRYEKHFILPKSLPLSNPSWFAFPVTIKDSAPFKRKEITQWFEDQMVQTRTLFTGNILRHPGYRGIRCRVAGSLANSDKIMLNTFMLGVYPGITEEMSHYMVQKLDEFMAKFPA